jgi:argininosuccinate synthase
MATHLLTASFGDEASNTQISRLARTPDTTVIAVALDIGGGPSLSAISASALAAGAARCHALDVRDDFVRAVLLPSARCTDVERGAIYVTLAAAFVANIVRTVADLEQGMAVDLERGGGWRRSVRRATTAGTVTLALKISGGEPVALNDIPMTLSQLVESVETIAGLSAGDILNVAYSELGGNGNGVIVLHVDGEGACTVAREAAVQA